MENRYIRKLKKKLRAEEINKLLKINNKSIHKFIADAVFLCKPKDVFICSDTPDEIAYIKNMAIVSGEESAALAIPGHTFHFDGYYDQGRDREITKFLIPEGEHLNPNLNQIEREQGLEEIFSLLNGSMRGKTMIVRFLTLGPPNSVFTIPCMECTDSWYVAHSVDLLYRKGYETFCNIPDDAVIFKTLHSAGKLDENMVSANYDKKRIYIDYTTDTVYSANTQYAGNSLGFKKLALRLAIREAHRNGWLAEHFMIIGVKDTSGKKSYLAGAFPSACGKTSTAMLERETILSDDIAYVRNIKGKCKAINVESGIFGIIQNINPNDDPLIYKVLTTPGEVIFSNVLIKDGRPWWLGMGEVLPKEGRNYSGWWYEGKVDEKGEEILPAHKNARYTVSLKALPNCDSELDNPDGIRLDGIMYGGRDYKAYVPVQQAFSWEHGIIMYGAALETETTFATLDTEGKYEINVMSIQDFLSIPLGKYIKNYLKFGKGLVEKPLVFGVNYFLKDMKTGEFLNERKDKHIWVKWIALRVNNKAKARKTPTGLIPLYEDIEPLFKEIRGKIYTKGDYEKQFTIRVPENLLKIERVSNFWKEIPDVPDQLFKILEGQKERLLKAQKEYGDYIHPDVFEVV
ncbi:MAG: phosphoenolpyruvate carboxykinase (GTP) [Candidatus Omnitrophica bacterium]|nr:phosphoenolpyruvate carboxykinase (GTP) [Candidatus Omnitrophota bacterium]